MTVFAAEINPRHIGATRQFNELENLWHSSLHERNVQIHLGGCTFGMTEVILHVNDD